MQKIVFFFLFLNSVAFGQMTMEEVETKVNQHEIGTYSYHRDFIGHDGYGAPRILTHDGGAAIFGDFSDDQGAHALLLKMDSTGKTVWKKAIRPQFDEMESQSVVEDAKGNLYVFMLSYNNKLYRGGAQRIVCFDKTGKQLWDKTIGEYQLLKNPTISYIRLLSDGRIALRGHVVTEKPKEGEDPKYQYWEGWMNAKGELTQKSGAVIDWVNQDWKKLFEVEKE